MKFKRLCERVFKKKKNREVKHEDIAPVYRTEGLSVVNCYAQFDLPLRMVELAEKRGDDTRLWHSVKEELMRTLATEVEQYVDFTYETDYRSATRVCKATLRVLKR